MRKRFARFQQQFLFAMLSSVLHLLNGGQFLFILPASKKLEKTLEIPINW
jgi:hypothetical protein